MSAKRLICMLRLSVSVALSCVFATGSYSQDRVSAVDESPPVLKVGAVYVGPVGDHGWTFQHHRALKEMEAHFSGKVALNYVANVPEGAASERVIRELARSGHDLIFSTAFGYMNPTLKVARQFPNVKFEHTGGYKRADNVATFSARFYEGRYVNGAIAGRMTRSNIVGYIASFPIPEVIRGINSAFLSARRVNPDVEFRIIWIYSWFDPVKEANATRVLIAQGADVLFQHTDSTAAVRIANEKGLYAFGEASDMSAFGRDAHLSASINNWTDYYITRVSDLLEGSWTSADTWDGVRGGMISFPQWDVNVPKSVQREAMSIHNLLVEQKLHPFTGPIRRQDGAVWLKAGEVASDEDLLKMNFFVRGISSPLPG